MITNIRPSTVQDLDRVMQLYNIARNFMRSQGNYQQWINGYPSKAFIREEIAAGHSFVCENENGLIVATFCFIIGEDPTYRKIYDGEWLNEAPYGTVHRMASGGQEKGVARCVFDWCFTMISNVRVDTHRDNRVMQHILQSYGFNYCGIIYLSDGSERLAYQKVKSQD